MAEDKQLEVKKPTATVKALATRPEMVSRFAEVLGGQEKANQFLANVITVVNTNKSLQACSPSAVMGCAMAAAALNLDVVPGLGFAAIVPYTTNLPRKDKNGKFVLDENGKQIWDKVAVPQFQIMKNGFVQLAMRSGQVKSINVTDIYKDELVRYDRLTGELEIRDVPGGMRDKGKESDIVGYVCYVRLINGFEKAEYWTIEKIKNHAQRYSQAYQYDVKNHKSSSPWSTNFAAMAEKTVIKATISKWVPMSTQMLLAKNADQSSFDSVQDFNIGADGEIEVDFDYVDNGNAQPAEEQPKKSVKEKYGIGTKSNPSEVGKVEETNNKTESAAEEEEIPWPEADEAMTEGGLF